jgi:hypothetical protein
MFVGAVYALVALGSIIPLVMLLAFGPRADQAVAPSMLLWYVFPLANVAACSLISYAFWGLRRWGRYVAIAYSVVWLVANILGPLRARGTEPTQWTPAAAAFWLLVNGFLVGVIVLCLTSSAKRIMVK